MTDMHVLPEHLVKEYQELLKAQEEQHEKLNEQFEAAKEEMRLLGEELSRKFYDLLEEEYGVEIKEENTNFAVDDKYAKGGIIVFVHQEEAAELPEDIAPEVATLQ